jgi:hypothetical protein
MAMVRPTLRILNTLMQVHSIVAPLSVKFELCFQFICRAGLEPSPLLLRPFTGLLHQPWTIDHDDCGAVGGMNE